MTTVISKNHSSVDMGSLGERSIGSVISGRNGLGFPNTCTENFYFFTAMF